jgi:hypothetical protein
MRTYRNGKPASNPKSLSRGVIKKDSARFKTVERVNDPEGKFARSIKAVYVDSDGDGFLDSYQKNYRNPVVDKAYKDTLTTTAPLPPQFAPTDITVTVIPQLQTIDFANNSFYPDFEWDGTTTADYAVQSGEVSTGDPKPLYVSKGNGHANTHNYQIIWYSNPSSSDMGGSLDTNSPTWIMIEPGSGVDGDFSGGSADISNGSSAFLSSSFTVIL